MNPSFRSKSNEKGTAFFIVTILAISTTALVGAFLSASLSKVKQVESRARDLEAFNAAEAGINAVAEKVWAQYKAAPASTRIDSLDPLDGKSDSSQRLEIDDAKFGNGSYSAEVDQVKVTSGNYADVKVTSTGTNVEASRTLVAVIRYGHEPSKAFDHAYFINNFGWLWGSGITVNGSVRSNGDMSLTNPTINGDIYAAQNSALGATGSVTGSYRNNTLDWYNTHYGTQARPTNPSATPEDTNGNGILDPGEDTNGNGKLDMYVYPDGYDGKSAQHPGNRSVQMPYLGDLTYYKNEATAKGGTISQGGTVLVNGVLGDTTGQDKNIILIGTQSNPIVVNGPVVVDNDVVIKGYITGQGTIYAGRNVHIIGDVTYENPPIWPKPMTDAAATKATNQKKDLVGFAAKGSIVLGNYTAGGWQSTTKSYMTPPFTQPYVVDPSDASIGYVTGYDSQGRPVFNGDYTAFDGGSKDAVVPSIYSSLVTTTGSTSGSSSSRRYYESSYPDSLINALADTQVQHVDGVLYTNHLLAGKVGSSTFNGTLVSRDEAIIYNGSLFINYDPRIRYGSYEFLNAFLPQVPSVKVLYWSEK